MALMPEDTLNVMLHINPKQQTYKCGRFTLNIAYGAEIGNVKARRLFYHKNHRKFSVIYLKIGNLPWQRKGHVFNRISIMMMKKNPTDQCSLCCQKKHSSGCYGCWQLYPWKEGVVGGVYECEDHKKRR